MKVAVYGIGNVLIGDDAAGPSVIRFLQSRWMFPDGVVIEDLGTPSLDLMEHLLDFDFVIFLDAVSASGEPGEIRTYESERIIQQSPSIRISPHDPSLRETILNMQLLGIGPSRVKLIGIIPESLEHFGLSDPVRKAVPAAAARVIGEMVRLGIEVKLRREGPVAPGFWEAA